MSEDKKSIVETSWDEFCDSGMLWFVNRILHIFGWVIVLECDEDTDKTIRAYCARTSLRGFTPDAEARGYEKIRNFLKDGI